MLFDMLMLGAAQGGVTGTIAGTQQSNSAVFTATVAIVGALVATQAPNTADFTANAAADTSEGTWASTQQANTAVFTGATIDAGAWASTQQANTAVFTASSAAAGAWASTQQANTATFGATVWDATSMPAGASFRLSAASLPVVSDGAVVSTWTDSVSGLAVSQATSGKQPKYRVSRSGGRPAVQFEGGQWMTLDATLNTAVRAIIDSGNFTVIVALANVASTSIGSLIGASAGSSAFNMIANGAYAGRYDGNVSGHTLPWTTTDYVTIALTSETAVAGNYGGMGIAFERDYMNGLPFRSTNAVVPVSSAGVGIGAQNDTGSGSGKFDVLDYAIYSTALRPWEIAQAHIALAQANNQPLPWGGLQRLDVSDGDSVTDGVGVDAHQSYPALMAGLRGRMPGQWANFGIGAIRVDQNTAKLEEIAALSSYLKMAFDINFFEYINAQNANQTSATIFANVKAYLARARFLMGGSRFNISDSTSYGRDAGDRPYASYRGVFNGLMNDPSTGIAPFADVFTPISTNVHIGDGNAYTTYSATYMQGDAVHPNAAGHVEIANIMVVGNNALDSVTATFGSFSGTQQANTSSFTAGAAVSGAITSTQQANTALFTGTVVDPGVVAGTIASTQQPNTASFTGASSVSGDWLSTQQSNTAAFTGGASATGAWASTQQSNSASFTGGSVVSGSIVTTSARDTADIQAQLIPLGAVVGEWASLQQPNTASFVGRVATNSGLTLSEIIPLILNSLVGGRVWQLATPDNLPRDGAGHILPFVLWHRVGGRDEEFIDQTMPTHRHARIQVQSCARGAITADKLHETVCQALLGSAYTVGVLGSPVGTYDADRKLHAPWQQFSIWFQP